MEYIAGSINDYVTKLRIDTLTYFPHIMVLLVNSLHYLVVVLCTLIGVKIKINSTHQVTNCNIL